MDPLSLTASIAAVVGVTGKVFKGLRKLAKLRGATQELDSLIRDIAEFDALIGEVQEILRESEDVIRQSSSHHISTCLQRTNAKMSELNLQVQCELNSPIGLLKWLKNSGRVVSELKKVKDDLLASLAIFCPQVASRVARTLNQLSQDSTDNYAIQRTEHAATREALNNQGNILLQLVLQLQDFVRDQGERSSTILRFLEVMAVPRKPEISENEPLKPTTAIHREQISPPVPSKVISIRNADSWHSPCAPPLCGCICHSEHRFQSPKALHTILGSIFVAWTGLPKFTRCCDDPYCYKRSLPSGSICIYLPPWLMARMASAVFRFTSYATPELVLRVPRVLWVGEDIFRFAKSGDVVAVQRLLKDRRATPFDLTSNWGQSALRLAVSYNCLEVCKLLLSENADPYLEDRTGLCAFDVAWNRILGNAIHLELQSALRTMFKETEMLEKRRFSRLHRIVLNLIISDLEDELRFSSQAAIDAVDHDGRTSLSWAAIRGDHSVVQLLLKYHADVSIPSRNGSTPLHWAVQAKDPSPVRLLLAAGADVNRGNKRLYAPLHFAASLQNDASFLKPLLDCGANIDARTYHGQTALMNASRANHEVSIRYLIDRGADIDARDKDDLNALLHAVCFSGAKALEVLMLARPDSPARRKEMRRAVSLAAKYSDKHTIEVLTKGNPRAEDIPREEIETIKRFAAERIDVTPGWHASFNALSKQIENILAQNVTQDSDSECEVFVDAKEKIMVETIPSLSEKIATSKSKRAKIWRICLFLAFGAALLLLLLCIDKL